MKNLKKCLRHVRPERPNDPTECLCQPGRNMCSRRCLTTRHLRLLQKSYDLTECLRRAGRSGRSIFSGRKWVHAELKCGKGSMASPKKLRPAQVKESVRS